MGFSLLIKKSVGFVTQMLSTYKDVEYLQEMVWLDPVRICLK